MVGIQWKCLTEGNAIGTDYRQCHFMLMNKNLIMILYDMNKQKNDEIYTPVTLCDFAH